MDENNQKNKLNNKVYEKAFDEKPDKLDELIMLAAMKIIEDDTETLDDQTEDDELPPRTRKYRIQINRLFRERLGGDRLPFPEVDNIYERVRSKLIVKFGLFKSSDRRQKKKT